MKKIILTEEQIKSIKHLLTEAASLDKIINALSKGNKDNGINQSDLADLIMTDPTAVTNSRGQFVGKYWKWIYNQYKQGNIHLGDQPELETALNTYNINKSQINRPIDSFNTLDELVETIAEYDDSFKATRTLSKGEQELEKVYEDQYVVVYIPHTWEAARKIGGDTHWCTASSNDHYFNHYLNRYGGEYYDIIRKSDGAKFQLHPESKQFMDSDDKPISFTSVFNSRKEAAGLISFLKGRGKDISEWEPKTWFDDVQAKLDAGEDPKDVFDYCGGFNEGFAGVVLNGKVNFINKEGKLLLETWFDGCGHFEEGFSRVKLNKKWNYINTDGKLLSETWFDWCYDFKEGFACVELNDKYNYINTEGKLLSDRWFDWCDDFYDGLARVELNGKRLYIDKNGKLYNKVPTNENRCNKMIVISEDIAKKIKKDIEMSEHRFMSNVKFFLAQLLEDPVNAKPSDILLQHGFTRIVLLKELSDLGVLERSERLSDKDKEGNWKTVTMLVKYKVKRKGLDTAILKIYTEHFENDDTKTELNEDGGAGAGGAAAGSGGGCAGGCGDGGGAMSSVSDCSDGATSCNSSGAYVMPLFPIVRRVGYGNKKKNRKKKKK